MTRFAVPVLGLVTLLSAAAVDAHAQPAKLNADTAVVVKGNNAFALDLYRKLAAEPGNVFFSPYSISNALAMTFAGARGETAMQMTQTLHFIEDKKLHPAFKDLILELNADPAKRKYQL